MAKKTKSTKFTTWSIIKRIFFVIFIIHVTWFLIFIFQKFPVQDFAIENLKKKTFIAISILIAVGLLYYFWLKNYVTVKKIAIVAREVFLIAYIAAVLYLLLGIFFNPLFTLTQAASLVTGNGLQRDYISYDEMGPNIKLAVIASEDQLFPDHDGFDLKAIKKAIKYNKRHPNKVRGASTISQQVAKNIFLWQGRSNFRKGLEVFFTFSIEKIWSKKTILERYINIAEMGRGVFGVQAAAKKYFNKAAKDLSRTEAAMIAACLPNPKIYTVNPMSSWVSARYSRIVQQMNNLEGDPDIQELIGKTVSEEKKK